MYKLNELSKNNIITAYGFKALKNYVDAAKEQYQPIGNEIVLSSLSPAVMAEMGICCYFAPVLSRGVVLNTPEDVYNADLSVNLVTVLSAPDYSAGYSKPLIVSRHAGTIEILESMYPNAAVLSGNVTEQDIDNAFVVGTLPPHLIQHAKAYQAVTITNFDYSRDGDLSGDELRKRIHISKPITITLG